MFVNHTSQSKLSCIFFSKTLHHFVYSHCSAMFLPCSLIHSIPTMDSHCLALGLQFLCFPCVASQNGLPLSLKRLHTYFNSSFVVGTNYLIPTILVVIFFLPNKTKQYHMLSLSLSPSLSLSVSFFLSLSLSLSLSNTNL